MAFFTIVSQDKDVIFPIISPSQYVNLFLLKVNIIDIDWQALVSSLKVKTQKGDEHVVIAFSYEKNRLTNSNIVNDELT